MKLGCGTVNFRNYPLTTALERIARAGYEYVEPQATAPFCPHVDVDKDDPERYRQIVSEFGFKGSTALWATHGAIIPDEQSVEYGKRCIEWAAAAHIPVVNIGDGFKPDGMTDEEAWRVLEKRTLMILETAEKHGIYLAFEPHGTFSLNDIGLKRIMGISQSPNLAVNTDAANVRRAAYVESNANSFTWKQADASRDEVKTLSSIINKVKHFHAKDIIDQRCVAVGDGQVDNRSCLIELKKHGYSGAISVETEGDFDAEEAQILIEASRKYLIEIMHELDVEE